MTLRSRRKKYRRSMSHGQSTVEFALVLPLIVFILMVIIQVAVSLSCYLSVSNASRQGARSASCSNDVEAGRTAAVQAAGGLPGDRAAIDVEFPEGRSKGSPVRVTVTYKMPFLLPGVARIIPSVTFRKATTMTLERSDQ